MFLSDLLPLSTKMNYLAYDSESGRYGNFKFKIKKKDGSYRAYILEMPLPYGRDSSMSKIHVLRDNGKIYVCVVNRIYTLKKMKAVAKLWARKYLRYLALGKLYEEKYVGNMSNFSGNYLLEQGIILIGGEINDGVAQTVVCQLLYLDKKYPRRPIQLWIDSPGGSVAAGLSIYDAINYVSADVETVAVGTAASFAALLLSSGTRGKRAALPSAQILIHQPLGEVNGQATDIMLAARRMDRLRSRLDGILAINTGKEEKVIHADTERDYAMTAEEALSYGLIDKIIATEPKAARR